MKIALTTLNPDLWELTEPNPPKSWGILELGKYCYLQCEAILHHRKKTTIHLWRLGKALVEVKRLLKTERKKFTDWKSEENLNDSEVSRSKRIYEQLTLEEALKLSLTEAYEKIKKSGKDECYTPSSLIKKFRAVLGEIDLDPASSEAANKTVNAKKFFTKEMNGLEQDWNGNIFLNPPFSDEYTWSRKLVDEILAGRVIEAIWIQSKTKCHEVLEKIPIVRAVPKQRPQFFNPILKKGTSGHWGTVLCYYGPNHGRFVEEFKDFAKTISIDSKYQQEPVNVKKRQGIASDECYTPPELVEKLRSDLGEIELDPASSSEANKTVKATTIYTKKEDGLSKDWNGKIFLNPPFSNFLEWVKKLVVEIKAGRVTQAVVVLPKWKNADVLTQIPVVEFVPDERPKFLKFRSNKMTTAPGGTKIFYYGDSPQKFIEVFKSEGVIRSDLRVQNKISASNRVLKNQSPDTSPLSHRPVHKVIPAVSVDMAQDIEKENPGFQLKTADYAKEWRKAPASLQLGVEKDCFEKLPEMLANCHKGLTATFELCKDFGSKNLTNEDLFIATNKNINSIIKACSDYQSVIGNNNESDIQA